VIRFQNAAIGYGAKQVLTGVNLEVNAGEFVGIVGPNGSGKTTFLRSILGLLPPVAGVIEVDRRRRFAYVPQADDLNLLWPLTVRDLVALAHRSHRPFGRLPDQTWRDIDAAIEKTALAPLANRRYSELSGGQRQRAILAQALSQKPDVLLLDEPTRGLDVRVEHDFLDLLTTLNVAEELTILLVTHTLAIPLNVTAKIFLVVEGTVLTTTPAELAGTDKLEQIYGMPFVHGESDGVRWVAPRRTR